MRVAIIGSGPAGLLAAHAVERSGHEPIIYGQRSQNVDESQFLFECPPGLERQTFELTIDILGRPEDYAKKVYGDSAAPVSLQKLKTGVYQVTPLLEVYEFLWNVYGRTATQVRVDQLNLPDIARSVELTLNTMTAQDLCDDPSHSFEFVRTYMLKGEASGENIMYYNGANDPMHPWFRYSRIRGIGVFEYACPPTTWREAPGETIINGVKPTGNNCDCMITGDPRLRGSKVQRIGRFGKWERGVMNHHAFQDAVAIMSMEGLGRSI
jgi:hypothetical protein